MTKYDKTELFETTPIPRAVGTLVIPTVAACLVMVLYNLADTFFVGMVNDPVQSSAVTLAAEVILAAAAAVQLKRIFDSPAGGSIQGQSCTSECR